MLGSKKQNIDQLKKRLHRIQIPVAAKSYQHIPICKIKHMVCRVHFCFRIILT